MSVLTTIAAIWTSSLAGIFVVAAFTLPKDRQLTHKDVVLSYALIFAGVVQGGTSLLLWTVGGTSP